MKFIVISLILTCTILLISANKTHRKNFDKRKTKLKNEKHSKHTKRTLINTRHTGDINRFPTNRRDLNAIRRDVISKVSQNIRKDILRELFFHRNESMKRHLSPQSREKLWRLRVQKSFITRLENFPVNFRNKVIVTADHEDLMGRVMRDPRLSRKDFIESQPRAKLETLNGILDRAVAHIFNKVLDDDSSSKKEHTSSYKKNTDSVFAVPRYEPKNLKNSSFNTMQKKELMLKYTKEVKDIGDKLKHEDSDKFAVDMDSSVTDPDNFFTYPEKTVNTSSKSNTITNTESNKSSNNTTNDKRESSPSNPLNDTLLRQIDEIDFAMPTNESDRVPKNFVSQNLMYAAFEPAEGEEPGPSYGAHDYNTFSREDGTGMVSPNNPVRNNIGIESNRGVPGMMEKDDETREMEKESEDEIRRKMSFFFGNKHHSLPTAFSNEDEDYDSKKSSEVDENSSFQTEKRILSSPEREYGTIFVKEGSDAKEINLYNADVHLAITVHSSADRFNAMKAVATVLKELGGLNFKEKHGGLVTKSEFDGVMVEADEEEDTSSHVNHPPNERQIKLTTFRGFTNSHPLEEREPMMNPLHAKKMLMMHTANEPVDEEKDEDAMNYYQKNKMGAGGPASVEPADAQEGGDEREKSLELEPASSAKSFGKKKSSKSIAKTELANENRAKAELANENAVNDSLVNSEKQSVDTYSADQLNTEMNIFPGENIKDAESAEFQHSTPAHKPAFLPELKTYNSSMHNKTGLFDSGEDLGESESKEPVSDGTHSVTDVGQNDGSWLGKIPTNVSDVISDNIGDGDDGEKTTGDVSDGISKQDNWIGSFASHLNSHQSKTNKKLNSDSDKDVVDIINPDTSLSSENDVKTTKSPVVLPVVSKTTSGDILDEKTHPVISQSPAISKEGKTVPVSKHSNSTVSQLKPEIIAGGGDNGKIVHLIQGVINSATNKDSNKPKMTSSLKNVPDISKTPIVMPETSLVPIKTPVTITHPPHSVTAPSSQVISKQVPATTSHLLNDQVKLVNKNPVSTSHSAPAIITIPAPIPANSIPKDNVDQNKTRQPVKIKLKTHGNSNKLFNNMKSHGNPNVHLMSSNMGKGNIKLLDVAENVFNIKPIGGSLGASGRSFPVLNSPAENSKGLSTIHGKSVPTLLFSPGKGDIGDEHLISLSGKDSVAKEHLKMAPILHKQTDANGLFRKAEPERGGKQVDVFHAKLPGTSENNQRLANLRENMRLMATGSKNVGLRNETGSSVDTHKRNSNRQKQKELLLQDYKAKFPDNSRKGMIKSGDVYFAKPIRKVIDEYSDIHGHTPADIAKMIASRENIVKTRTSDGIQDELTHSGDNENEGDNTDSDDGDNGVTLNDDPEDDIENFEIHKTSKSEFMKSKEVEGAKGGYFAKKHKHKPNEKENEDEDGAQEVTEAENGNLLFYPLGTGSSKTLTGTIRNISSNLIADIFDGKQSANFSEDIKRFTEISLPQLFESLEINETTTTDEKKLSANDTKPMASANKTTPDNETTTVLHNNTTAATKKEADTTKSDDRPTKFGPFEFPDNTFLSEQPDIQVVNVYDHHKKTPGVDNSLLTPRVQKVPPVAGSNDANSVIVFNTFLNSTDSNDPGVAYRKVDMSPKTLQKVSSSLGTNGLGMMVPMGMVSNDSEGVGTGEAHAVPVAPEVPIGGNNNAEDASFESEGLENMLMQDTMDKEPSLNRNINSDRLESHPMMHHQPKMHHSPPRMHQKPAVHHAEPKINPYKSNEINRAIARLEQFTGVDKDVFNDITSIRNGVDVNINDGEHHDNYANTNDGKPFAHEVSFLPAKNEMKIPKDWFVGFTRKEIENMKSKTKNEDKHLKHMINKFVDDNSQHMTNHEDKSDLSDGDNPDLYDGDTTNDDDDVDNAVNNDDKGDNNARDDNSKEDEEFSYMQDWDEGKPTYDGDKSMNDGDNEKIYNGVNKNIIRPEIYKTDQHNLELNALSTEDRKNLHKNIDTDLHNIMSVMGNMPTQHLGDRKSQTFNQSVVDTPLVDNLNDPNLSNDQKMYSLLDNLKETLSSSETEKEKKYPLVNNLHLSRTNDRDPFKFNPYPYIEAISASHTSQNKLGLKPYSLLTNFKQAHTAHKIGNENQQTRYDRDPFRFKPIQFISDPKHISGLTRLPGTNQIAWNNNPKLPTKLVLTKNVKPEESANLIPVTSHIRRAHPQKQLLNGAVLTTNIEPVKSIRNYEKYPALAVVKQQETYPPSLVENESAKLQPSLKTKDNNVIQSFSKNNQEQVKTEVDNLAKAVSSLDAKSETPDSLRKYVNEISSAVKSLNQNRLSLFEEQNTETSESSVGRESPRKGEARTNMGKFEKEINEPVSKIEYSFKKHSQGKKKQELPLNVDSNLYDDINAIKPFSHNIDKTLHKNIDVDLYNVNNVLKSIEEGKRAKEDAMKRQAKHYGAKDLARDEVGDRLDSLLEMLRQENTKDEPEKSNVAGSHDKHHDSHASFTKQLVHPSVGDTGNNDDVDYMKFEREQEMLNSLQHKYNQEAVKKLVKKQSAENDFSKYDEYQDFTKTKPENYKENEPSPEYIMSDKDEFTNNFHMLGQDRYDEHFDKFKAFGKTDNDDDSTESSIPDEITDTSLVMAPEAFKMNKSGKISAVDDGILQGVKENHVASEQAAIGRTVIHKRPKSHRHNSKSKKSRTSF